MSIYFPNQRYTSEGEPELGVGILIETSKGRVKVHFPSANENRLYASDNAPLRRINFKPGDTIKDVNNRTLLIERIDIKDELFIYQGQEVSISEADLGDVTVNHCVTDKLLMGDVDSHQLFALRRETLQHDYKRKISPVNGFVGGRIELIPHQLYIAHEVSSRYAPRVLLSDQVGLGKTIEACLILHRLLMSGRVSRVLILVPESLVHQWFVEVLRRFNLWFNIFDEERCASLDNGAPDGNPFLDDQLIICSTEFLSASNKRAQQALTADWDMLVVDEAHHLEWSAETVSPEYTMVEQLSKVAKGLLLLTATPEQLGEESHFARLRLLDPVRYADYNAFINETSDHKNTANIVEKLLSGDNLTPKDTKALATIFSAERIKALVTGGEEAKNNLIEDLLDQHGPGRVLFRNTRAAMSGFPKRIAHLVPLTTEKNKLWVTRLTNEFKSDMNLPTENSDKQQFWFEEDPRVDWLLDLMMDLHRAKALLICRTKEKVMALAEALSKMTNMKFGVFHEDLTIIQRDKNAAWFAESNGARLLICSEIGSEGRNFQFAHNLILFDLPLHPELLEQRIGRLDRIGQNADIHIHIPYIENSPQQALVRWYNEGLNAFEENIEGGNKISSIYTDRLLLTATSYSGIETDNQLNELITETSSFQKELKETLANGRDRLLEMNSYRPETAEKLVNQILSEDNDSILEDYMLNVFEQFEVDMEDLAPRTYFLHPDPTNSGAFPTIPAEGLSVTFDRKRALSREDIGFLTWEHPMITGAIDMVLSSGTGSASYAILRGTGSGGLLTEFLFILETAGTQGTYVDRFLPNKPLRIVVDHTGKNQTDLYPIDKMERQLISGRIDDLLENETLTETILPKMIAAGEKYAETLAAIEISKGLQRMNQALDHEIERLKSLQIKNKDIRPEEIEIALNEQKNLTLLIQNAKVRMDALQLIWKE